MRVPDSEAFVLSDFSTAQSRLLPGHRYEIDDRHGKPVSELGSDETSIALAELPPPLKSIGESIVEGSRESHPYDAPAYGADSLPDDLVRIIEEYDYVECVWEGKPVAIAFEIFENDVTRPPLLEVESTLVQDRITQHESAEIVFSLTNRGSEPVEVESDPPWPFGVPHAIREPDDRRRRETWDHETLTYSSGVSLQLWTDEYEEYYPVSEDDFPFQYGEWTYLNQEIDSISESETITTDYRLPLTNDTRPGEYLIPGYFEYDPNDGRSEVLRYDITFLIESDQRSRSLE